MNVKRVKPVVKSEYVLVLFTVHYNKVNGGPTVGQWVGLPVKMILIWLTTPPTICILYS